jgi:hypothetical protein
MKKLGILFFGLFAAHVAFAQEAVDPTVDFLKLLIESIGGMKGASALAIAALVVQLIVRFLDLPFVGGWFGEKSGWIKLLIVSGLTMVAAPIGLVATGMSWPAALIHSATLSAVMVFVNQVMKQFAARKE